MGGARRLALLALAAALFFGFIALGTWQVQRRIWKLDLIERVEARVHAAPVPAPLPPAFDPRDDEYRHVALAGTFLHDQETLVQAVTVLGSGFWVITPLRTEAGTVLVNRGFVPPEARAPAARGRAAPQGAVRVTGLLRLSEPHGAFLRANEPANERWFSRDVAAIAAARGLGPVAPYYMDEDAAAPDGQAGPGAPPAWPVGGLTVVRFANSHLVYALTWYALALMVAGAAWLVRRAARLKTNADAPHP